MDGQPSSVPTKGTPSAPSAVDIKQSAAGMSTAELRTHVERCRRLVERPQLLERLPDGGESIRNRLDIFTVELGRRAEVSGSAPIKAPEESRSSQGTAAQVMSAPSGGAAAADSEAASYASNVQAIMEKYKDRRVPVEETVRKMYGSSLSEKEIARILEDVPPHFFLTYSETTEREKDMAKQARLEELAKLRQQALTRK